MKVEPLGEGALLLRELKGPAATMAAAISDWNLPGLIEAVASYDTFGVFFDPLMADRDALIENLRSFEVQTGAPGVNHRIPVCYALGDDLDEVANRLGQSPDSVIEAHSQTQYTCFAIGFRPGFPYLGYLPEVLRGIPRRDAPRAKVAKGAVAITGQQTGIYPQESPGGWAILGYTPLTIADLADAYFPIEAGDTVEFYAISEIEFKARLGERL